MSSIRVVVVDDEPDVRKLLELQLGLLDGFEVVGAARDGAEALQLCRDSQPDAVVMDLLMPDVTGFDALSRLRAEFPDIAAVAYTGVAGDFVRDVMTDHGVEVVLKSGDPEPLAAALRRAVEAKTTG
jgi:DNA-binding NarL/FixJ family response regulator